MHAFIKSISDSLETMIKTRQEFFDNYYDLVHSDGDQKTPQRLCDIYAIDAREILSDIIFKLELDDTDLNFGQHTISSVIRNFWHTETIESILKAYNTYHDKAEMQVLVDKLNKLALEMQECLNGRWSVAEDIILQD